MAEGTMIDFVVKKMNECGSRLHEIVEKTVLVNRVVVKLLKIWHTSPRIEISFKYHQEISALYEGLNKNETEFYHALHKIIKRVEKHICTEEMIVALTDFWEKHEFSPKVLEEYYEKWFTADWFKLISKVNYKPFWIWMFGQKIVSFDIASLISDEFDEISFSDIIQKIAEEEKYVQLVFDINFEHFLNSVWKAVGATYITIDEVFSVICGNLPTYEKKILNHAYLNFMKYKGYNAYENESGVNAYYCNPEDFVYILDRMADYEYMWNSHYFSSVEKSRAPWNKDDGEVNVVNDAPFIIINFAKHTAIKDIVWILENRFGVKEKDIDEWLFNIMNEVYTSYTLDELLEYNFLWSFFQFPIGYKLFLWNFDDIVKSYDSISFIELEDAFDIVGTFVNT